MNFVPVLSEVARGFSPRSEVETRGLPPIIAAKP